MDKHTAQLGERTMIYADERPRTGETYFRRDDDWHLTAQVLHNEPVGGMNVYIALCGIDDEDGAYMMQVAGSTDALRASLHDGDEYDFMCVACRRRADETSDRSGISWPPVRVAA